MGKKTAKQKKLSHSKQRHDANQADRQRSTLLHMPINSGGLIKGYLIATKLSKNMLRSSSFDPTMIMSSVTDSLQNGAKLSHDPMVSNRGLSLFLPHQRDGIRCYLLNTETHTTLLIHQESACIIAGYGVRNHTGDGYDNYWCINGYTDKIHYELTEFNRTYHGNINHKLGQESDGSVDDSEPKDEAIQDTVQTPSRASQGKSLSEHTSISPKEKKQLEDDTKTYPKPEDVIWQSACRIAENNHAQGKPTRLDRHDDSVWELHNYCTALLTKRLYQISYHHINQRFMLECIIRSKRITYQLPWTIDDLMYYCTQLSDGKVIWPVILPLIHQFPVLLSLMCTEHQKQYLASFISAYHETILQGLYRFEHHDSDMFNHVTQTIIDHLVDYHAQQTSLTLSQTVLMWQYLTNRYESVDSFVIEQSKNTTDEPEATVRLSLIRKMIDSMYLYEQAPLSLSAYTWLFSNTNSQNNKSADYLTLINEETRTSWHGQFTDQMNQFHTACTIESLTPYTDDYLELCLKSQLSLSQAIQDCARGVLKRRRKQNKKHRTTTSKESEKTRIKADASSVRFSKATTIDSDTARTTPKTVSFIAPTRSAYHHERMRNIVNQNTNAFNFDWDNHLNMNPEMRQSPTSVLQQAQVTTRLRYFMDNWEKTQSMLEQDARSMEIANINHIVHAANIDDGQLTFQDPASISWFIDKETPGFLGFWQDPVRKRIASEWQQRLRAYLISIDTPPEKADQLLGASDVCYHYLTQHHHKTGTDQQGSIGDCNCYVRQAAGIIIIHASPFDKNDLWAQLHNDFEQPWRENLIRLFQQFSAALIQKDRHASEVQRTEELDELIIAITRSTTHVTIENHLAHRGIYIPKYFDNKNDAQRWLHSVSSQLHWIRERKSNYSVIKGQIKSPLLIDDFRQAFILSGYCGTISQHCGEYHYAITCKQTITPAGDSHNHEQAIKSPDMHDFQKCMLWLTSLGIMPDIRGFYAINPMMICVDTSRKSRKLVIKMTLETAIPEVFMLFAVHHNSFEHEDTDCPIQIQYDEVSGQSTYDNRRLSLFVSIWAALLKQHDSTQADLVTGILAYLTGAISWDWSRELMKYWPGLLHNCYLATQSVLNHSESSSDAERNKILEKVVILFYKAGKKFEDRNQAFADEVRKKNTDEFELVEVCCNNSIFLGSMREQGETDSIDDDDTDIPSSTIPSMLTAITRQALLLLGLRHEKSPTKSEPSKKSRLDERENSHVEEYHIPDLGLFSDTSSTEKPVSVSKEVQRNRVRFFKQEYQKLFQRTFKISVPFDIQDSDDPDAPQTLMQRASSRAEGLCHFEPQLQHDCSVCAIPKL